MERLALKVNDQYLDLGGQTVNIKLLNPALNSIQSHSFPFNIPQTKHNLEVLGLINENSYSPEHIFSAEIEGSFRFNGQLKVFAVGKNLEGVLHSGSGAFVNLVKDKRVYEVSGSPLVAGEDDADVRSYLYFHKGDVFPDADYTAFPVSAPGYVPELATRAFNEYDRDTNAFVDDPDNLKPFIFIGKVLELIFGTYGYSVVENCFRTDARFQGYVLFHCNEIDWGTIVSDGWGAWLPDILITDFIRALRNRLNVVCYVDEINKTASIRFFDDDIAEGYTADLTNISHGDRVVELDVTKEFRLVGGDDDDTINRYLNKLAVVVDTTNDLPAASYEVAYVKNKDTYYIGKYDSGWDWVESKSAFNKSEPEGGEELSCDLKHLANVWYADRIDDGGSPATEDTRWRIMPQLPDNDLSRLTFLQYLGFMDEITTGVLTPLTYPMGSMGCHGNDGSVSVSQCLTPDESAQGLRSVYWSNTEVWYNIRKLVKRKLIYSSLFFSSFNFYKLYRIKDHDVVFSSIELVLDFGRQKVSFGDTEMYTV